MLGSKNKKKLTLLRKFKNFFSYKFLKRSSLYYYFKLLRSPDDLQKIARGFAFGVAISFTPFIGFHLILLGLFCLLFRASFVAGAIGSLIGNPFTFPFIWFIVFWSGNHIVGTAPDMQISFVDAFKDIKVLIMHMDLTQLAVLYHKVLYPMLVGAVPFFVISYLLSYFTCSYLVGKYRKKKLHKNINGTVGSVKFFATEVAKDVVKVEKKIEEIFHHTVEDGDNSDSVMPKKKSGDSSKNSNKKGDK